MTNPLKHSQAVTTRWGLDVTGTVILFQKTFRLRRASSPADTADAKLDVNNLRVVGTDLRVGIACGTPERRVTGHIDIPLAKIDLARALAAEVGLLEKRDMEKTK